MATIDIKPTWRGVLRMLLTGLTDGNATGQSIAREELERMADAADAYNARVAAPLDWRPVSEYVNSGDRLIMDDEPLVMLWEAKAGATIGRVMKFADGEVLTRSPGYHGFTFTHFATFNTPAK